MAFSVVMPALEMAQETGKLIAWRKKEGERVTKGEPLLEIETDKAVMEIEAPADGILAGVSAQTGSDIPVGQTIAWIVAPGENLPSPNEPATAAPSRRAKIEAHSQPVAAISEGRSSSQSSRMSPKARRLAKELGVDISTLQGSGPDGEILASDIQAAAAGTPTRSLADKNSQKLEVPSTLGRLMAERTTQSWTTVPHFFVTREIDAAALNEYRAKKTADLELSHKIRITHTDILVAIIARILLKHPRLNASWTGDRIHLHDHVNMGVAIAVDDGVVAAVIANAHAIDLAKISGQRHEITERARSGKLRPADIADATFTVSNLGMYGVDSFSAIIIPPQAAILAVGSISERVVAVGGKAVVRPMISLTLSCDHRVCDGARAALFLGELAEALQEPEKLLSSS